MRILRYLILGSTFLATPEVSFIYVIDSKLVLRVEDEEVLFKITNALKPLLDQDDICYLLDTIDVAIADSI